MLDVLRVGSRFDGALWSQNGGSVTETTIGTCSLCGGPVRVPVAFMSVNQPVPRCANCGATKRGHGPVIEMERRRVEAKEKGGTKL